MADRSTNVLSAVAAIVLAAVSLTYCAFGAHAGPSLTCTDSALEEARITEELAKEQHRLSWTVTGDNLAVFVWNMKWAFNIDIDADTVYIIEALTTGSNIKSVHLFTVRNHCITHYALTWGAVIAEMLRPDAWERGNPHVDGQTDRTVPANRPPTPATPAPPVPAQGLPPRE